MSQKSHCFMNFMLLTFTTVSQTDSCSWYISCDTDMAIIFDSLEPLDWEIFAFVFSGVGFVKILSSVYLKPCGGENGMKELLCTLI